MIITKQTTTNDIITARPRALRFFEGLRMSCGSCLAVKFDTLENGALMHGMNMDALMSQLNQFISSLPSNTEANF